MGIYAERTYVLWCVCLLIEIVYIYTDVYIYIHTHTGASGRAGGRGSGGDRAPRGSAVLADAGVLQWAWGSTAIQSVIVCIYMYMYTHVNV